MSGTAHEKVETNLGLMIVLMLVVVSIAGLVQILPLYFMRSTMEPVTGLKPYAPLQLTGRDIYIRESCMVSHSQMIRPFRAETERYGPYSVAGEFIYDRPFQWGSKRTGPQVAKPPMDQLRGLAARAAGKIPLLEEGRLDSAHGRVPRDPGAGDPPADHNQIEGLSGQALEIPGSRLVGEGSTV